MAKKKRANAAARRAQPRHLSSQHDPRSPLHPANSPVTQPFSLRDEARYMSSHRSAAFDSSKKLRHLPVAFVSAGFLEGTVQEQSPRIDPASSASLSPSPVATDALAHMTIRSPSPAPSAASTTSEELIVFRGRGQTPLPSLTSSTPMVPAQVDTDPLAADTTAASVSAATDHQPASSIGTPRPTGASTDDHTSLNTAVVTSVAVESVISTGAQNPTVADQHGSDVDSDTNSVVQTHFEKRRGGRPIWEGRVTPWVSRSKPGIGWLPVKDRPDMDAFVGGEIDPREAAMDDYMQNIEDFGLTKDMVTSAGFAHREMDLDAGSHNDWRSDPELTVPRSMEEDDGWNSDMLRDLDGMSTSTDIEETVVRILRKRVRVSGSQYLVVYQGSTPDDARWLPAAFLTASSDKALVDEYEAYLASRPQPSSSSPSEFQIDGESDEEVEADVDDEEIARAFQLQAELGIDSDDLVLHGADNYFGGPSNMSARARVNQLKFDRPNKKRQQRVGGGRRAEPSYPSAAAMADALDMDPYGAFDIMDTERPSLRPVKKGRRGQKPPELDDSDLNDQLQASWEADRTKKRLKKAEREELRKNGELGRKDKAPDLSVRYEEGIVMEEVIEEIRTFMASDMQTLALPPMEAPRRAAIHQFVNALGVTSRSRGDGPGRFTVLFKTNRTFAFDDDAFDALLDQKKYKNRLLARTYAGPSMKKKDKGAKTRPAVSYLDGEVVGASAPELGSENRGRELLEKMGWKKGEALGAEDNKGILHPIAHTVKTTKAGLR